MNNLIIRECSSEESDFIVDKIVEYNLARVPLTQSEDFIWVNRVIEDSKGEIVGGIRCKIYCWNCMYVDVLWIKDDYRKEGLGSRLLTVVEDIGKKENCHLIHLDTFDFQAKDFYLKHGYEIFGVLENCPKDHNRYYLKKDI